MNNFVVLKGRVGQDPEFKVTQSNKKLAKFSIAVWAGKDKTNWINVTAWNGLATSVYEDIRKGDEVIVVGKWSTSKSESGIFHDLTADEVGKALNTWDNEESSEHEETKKK